MTPKDRHGRRAKQDVALVDLKIECGQTRAGDLVVADVIDNDSWRIWRGGNPAGMLDKQLYRDGQMDLIDILACYEWVAGATGRF